MSGSFHDFLGNLFDRSELNRYISNYKATVFNEIYLQKVYEDK